MRGILSRVVPSVLALLAGMPSTARAQVALGPLDHPDSMMRDRFGGAMASDGSTLVVGEHGQESVQQVYVYSIVADRPILQQVLSSLDVPAIEPLGDRFGWSCSVDGESLIVGCPSATAGGAESAGAALVYRRIDGTWTWTQTLIDPASQVYAYFGESVCVRGERVAVGAHWSGQSKHGSVSLFVRKHGLWALEQKLNGYWGGTYFGTSVAVDGDWLLVGAPSSSVFVKSHAYFFQHDGSATGSPWKLKHDYSADWGQGLGYVVAMQGDLALAADPGHFDTGGIQFNRVFAYELGPSGSWSQTQILTQPETDEAGSKHVSFGLSLAFDGSDLLVGSPYFKEAGTYRGRAYRFRQREHGWVFVERLKPPVSEEWDTSGSTVALASGLAFLGNPNWDSGCGPDPTIPHFEECSARGLVNPFLQTDAAQPYCHCGASAPCGNVEDYGGCTNSTGSGATLGAGGSVSLSADELRLQASGLSVDPFVVLLAGTDATSATFGDGQLCVAGSMLRFPLTSPAGHGVAGFGPGLAAQAAALAGGRVFEAGETWHFQAVYRDSAGPCGGGINLTNAVRVDFEP